MPFSSASLSSSSLDDEASIVSFMSGLSGYVPDTSNSVKPRKEQDRQTLAVTRWRTVVVVMLLTTAALVVTSTYMFLSNSKQAEFEKSFLKSAHTIMDAAEFTARNNIQTMEALADGLTAEAVTVNATWPFFTSHNFEIKAAHARIQSFSEAILFMPLVTERQRKEWESYSVENQEWIRESTELGELTADWLETKEFFKVNHNQQKNKDNRRRHLPVENEPSSATTVYSSSTQRIKNVIFNKAEDNPGGVPGDISSVEDIRRLHYAPVWQVSPPPLDPTALINYNLLGDSVSVRLFNAIEASGGQVVVSEFLKTSSVEFFYKGVLTDEMHRGYHDSSQNSQATEVLTPAKFPHSMSMAPVHQTFDVKAPVVGYVCGIYPWDLYLSRLLPEGVNGVFAVLSNSCSQTVTYLINGPVSIYLGSGDLHEPAYDAYKESLVFEGFGTSTEESRRAGQCDYTLTLYASDDYRQDFDNKNAVVFSAILSLVFFATGAFFFIFVVFVQKRQASVVASALQSDAIVSSLFPSNVRARIMAEAEEHISEDNNTSNPHGNILRKSGRGNAPKHEEIKAQGGEEDATNVFGTKPIADLFPETTLMFGDLVGFTAWSSVRDPTQVFTLLETVYHSFDEIAKKRRIFKVETVGDCYVAVAGLPEPRKDHALAMARFAMDCQARLGPLMKRLEVTLGPDTGDLDMRFGLHSGPVTAGVLRGDRARFQLFGDTMNTCSRIETTGQVGKIHLSKETADLLIALGKSHWVTQRTEKVVAKGKGVLETFWLKPRAIATRALPSENGLSDSSRSQPEEDISEKGEVRANYPDLAAIDDRTVRLVNWNAEMFMKLLRQIAASRKALKVFPSDKPRLPETQGTVIDEVAEIVHMADFDAALPANMVDPSSIDMGMEVEEELRDYVRTIAMLYRANSFHNFEHASHVTMSVAKLMARIVNPKFKAEDGDMASKLHDHTYGITSDPLTQFACVYSALIHDVDHKGVPNTQLIKEDPVLARLYKKKSVAEQKSVDLAWHLLMDEKFSNLQKAIYSNTEELHRFRQLVVNSVMATDIMDKDLKALRNARWDKAFKEGTSTTESKKDTVDRKATIVIEHLIQASDVAHTMQHWHIYRKWNQRLFEEMYQAFREGRSQHDPSTNWYEGEIGFFDFYIIPLAKKLKDCGVFGVSSVEYLTYAEKNRAEWELKGRDMVAEMTEKIHASPSVA